MCVCVSCLNQDIGVHALAVATIRTGSVPLGSRGSCLRYPQRDHVEVSIQGVPQNGWFIRDIFLKWVISGYPHLYKPPCVGHIWGTLAWKSGTSTLISAPGVIAVCFAPKQCAPLFADVETHVDDWVSDETRRSMMFFGVASWVKTSRWLLKEIQSNNNWPPPPLRRKKVIIIQHPPAPVTRSGSYFCLSIRLRELVLPLI